MKFGMTDEQFSVLKRFVIQPLQDEKAKVYLFGSRTTPNHHPYSDVDILFETENEISTQLIGEIKEKIEESNFPYSVDLVSVEGLAESYRDRVMAEKILVSD